MMQEKKKSFSILITGDLVINQEYNCSKIDQKVRDLFNETDLNIVNLEAPITTNNSKLLKTGPHLKGHKESTFQVLKTLNVDVVTLANNHILDYGEQGVKDTLSFCSEIEIQVTGAGNDLSGASKTFYKDTSEGRIAIINFAENEWASATEETAGANPMSVVDNVGQIKTARESADFVFIIIHGGHEYYNLPSPRMQKLYRFYAEQGVDLIVGHHTHCISGYEVYNDVPIYYSLGNFLFTNKSTYEDWYTGLVLVVEIKNGKLKPTLHPVRQQRLTFELNLLAGTEKEHTLTRISEFNMIINDKLKLKYEWNKYIDFKSASYLNYLSPLSYLGSSYLRAAFNKLKIRLVKKRVLALMLNLMRCEAHADISKETIIKYLSK